MVLDVVDFLRYRFNIILKSSVPPSAVDSLLFWC